MLTAFSDRNMRQSQRERRGKKRARDERDRGDAADGGGPDAAAQPAAAQDAAPLPRHWTVSQARGALARAPAELLVVNGPSA